MSKLVRLNVSPETASDEYSIRKLAGSVSGIPHQEITSLRIIRKSIDARKKNIVVNLEIEVLAGNEHPFTGVKSFNPQNVEGNQEVIIVGAGPAGLFAALRLIELGLRPVIFERGRDVSNRKKDIARISREHIINPDSNYCFGEGGAGAFSDGKLYTRSKKRGDNKRILELLCIHGAKENILYESHPHIGTDKLPGIISNIKKTIIDSGGLLLLEKKVSDLILDGDKVKGVVASGNEKFYSGFVILATGHSARDIYHLCKNRGIKVETKSFAMGIRVEHPQELIDRIQYHGRDRGKYLPAAEYRLVSQVDGRGVYSFCMCPGGFIVPSATSREEIVVNGMSPSLRNSPFANSGIVVEIRPGDSERYRIFGEMAGLEFQKDYEKAAWESGSRNQTAPAQRLIDFMNGLNSTTLPEVSYSPGVTSSPMHEWIPVFIRDRLIRGFSFFGSSMKGYLTNEAVIVGVESRTSSPVRIPRNPDNLEHIAVRGLYPCGEGSGYSGGIVSSAIDGMKIAEAIAFKLENRIIF
jgi:uncharacterized FAD-dependent dehydrogenase